MSLMQYQIARTTQELLASTAPSVCSGNEGLLMASTVTVAFTMIYYEKKKNQK